MSTMENVRDLDRLRMAFHDPKLNYFGVSYGTTIGAVYRNVFPNTVRSMVLHGVVDNPARFNDFRRYVVSDAYESNRTMSAMLMACDRAGRSACAFAGGAQSKYDRLTKRLGSTGAGGVDFLQAWLQTVGTALRPRQHVPAERARPAAENLQASTRRCSPPTEEENCGCRS